MKKLFFVLLLLIFCFKCFSETFTRIVSLGPYITENLLLLDIKNELLGVTIHEKPEIKKGKTLIGTLLEPNIEIIARLKPDIVIASKEGNRKETVEKLESLGINVLVLDEVTTYEDLKKNFLLLAKILEKEESAKKIIKEIEDEIKKLKKKNSEKKIFWQLGTKPLVTAGRNTYFNELSNYAGTKNIFEDIETKYITINTEEVIKRNPDIIVAMGMGEQEYIIDFWKSFKNVKAVKNNKIYRVDDYDFCSPTPLSFLKSVKMLKTFLKN